MALSHKLVELAAGVTDPQELPGLALEAFSAYSTAKTQLVIGRSASAQTLFYALLAWGWAQVVSQSPALAALTEAQRVAQRPGRKALLRDGHYCTALFSWNLATGERLEATGWGPTRSSEWLQCVIIAFTTSPPDPQGWATS